MRRALRSVHPLVPLAILLGLSAGCASSRSTAAPLAGTTAATPTPVVHAAPPDSFAAERDSLMNDMLARIAGREEVPADSVFRNIRVLKRMPAGRLLRIMNLGWGRSLGVGCAHCHVVGHWDAEDKPTKQVARDMSAMTAAINNEHLPAIRNLKSEKPRVNCTTCHRGMVKPALELQ